MRGITDLRIRLVLVTVTLGVLLAGCESMNWRSPDDYFTHMKVKAPVGTKVSVCHGYGCKYRTAVSFTADDLAQIGAAVKKGGDTAAGERKGVASAIALIERIVGKVAGTDKDLGQLHLEMAGKRGQQDCVDEATNTTSYLVMMKQNGLLKYHSVKQPSGRGFFLDGRWQHFSAVLEDESDGKSWVVDSWPKDNGKPPVILPLKTWMKDYDNYA